MTLSVDLFWSFRSPYSYLATGRIVALERDWNLAVDVRPVLPLAVRDPSFFSPANRRRAGYIIVDAPRVAAMQGIPFRWPKPDPIVQDMATLAIAEDQPYIFRLTRLGAAAAEAGRGLPLIDAVSDLIFGGTEGWNEGDHLARAAGRAELDLAELDAAVAADPARWDAVIEANQAALEAAGHWGVPTLVFDGEPFFGQDRIDMCLWRMREKRLAPRA
jgi:2-hydroxychromene-2-carboxylate isomerase